MPAVSKLTPQAENWHPTGAGSPPGAGIKVRLAAMLMMLILLPRIATAISVKTGTVLWSESLHNTVPARLAVAIILILVMGHEPRLPAVALVHAPSRETAPDGRGFP